MCMVEFDLHIWLDSERELVKRVKVENELVKYMLIHLFSRPYRKDFEEKEEGCWEKRVQTFVASTGDGKTFSFKEALATAIRVLGPDQFLAQETPLVAFASSVKATIPVKWKGRKDDVPEDMMKAWVGDGLLSAEQYKRCVLVYHGVFDNLEENLQHDMWNKLSSCEVLPVQVIQNLLRCYREWSPKVKRDNEDVKERLRNADYDMRRAIRKYILGGMKSIGINNPDGFECLRFIREPANGIQFVEELYPEVALPEKKVVFLTVSKAFETCSPMVYPSGAFFNLPPSRGGCIFIDESDQAYTTLRDSILESLSQPYDYIVMFYSLANGFMNPAFSKFDLFLEATLEGTVGDTGAMKELRVIYDGTENGLGLRDEVIAFYRKYNFACCNFVSDKDYDSGEDRDGFFLFNSYFRVGVVGRKGSIFPRVKVNDNYVSLGYVSDREPEPDEDFYVFLNEMRQLVTRSLYFLVRLGYVIAKWTSGLDDESIRTTIRRLLFRVLLSIQTYGERLQRGMTLHEKLLYDMSYLGRKIGVVPSFFSGRTSDTEVAATGFDFMISSYPFTNVNRIGLMEVECNMTPESKLLAMAEKMDVLLVSASADFNCLIRNFNLKYLEKKVAPGLFQSKEEMDEISACHERKMAGSSSIDLNVVPFGLSEAQYREECRQRWSSLLGLSSESKQSWLGKRLKRVSLSNLSQYGVDIYLPEGDESGQEVNARIFRSIRLYNLVEFVIAFIERYNQGICPFGVYYLNVVLKDGNDDDGSPQHIDSMCNILKIIDFYLDSHPIVHDVVYEGKKRRIRAKDFLMVADSERIDDVKKAVQDNLDQKLPALILTSSKSAAVGQNFQMFVSPEYDDKLVTVGDRPRQTREKDGYICCNIAMLGMEKPTHVLFDLDFGFTPEKRLSSATKAIYDVLSVSDAGEVKPALKNMLIRAILDRCGRFGSQYWKDVSDDEADAGNLGGLVKKIRNTDTVAAAETVVIFQETGRFNREPVKFRHEFLHLDRRTRLVNVWREDRLLTFEFSRLMQEWNNEEGEPSTPKWNGAALNSDERTGSIIRRMVEKLRIFDEANVKYEWLKQDIVSSLFLDEEAYKREVNQEFWLDIGDKDGYYVLYYDSDEEGDSKVEDTAVARDLRCKDICLEPPEAAKGKKARSYKRIDVASTGLPDMLKVEGFSAYLDAKGVRYDWKSHGRYMLCPYALTLYAGTIGELFAEFILERAGTTLERFGNNEKDKALFELFDYRFGGSSVLLDVKHWSRMLRGDRSRSLYMKKVKEKAVTCQVDRVVYLNCFGSGTGALERTYPLKDGTLLKVLEVDGIARKDGTVLDDNVRKIQRFVYGF